MNSGNGESNNKSSVVEELSAYLDGELDQVEMQKVELRLGSDPEYLSEMQSLQRTWDLLDELPLREPRASFTKTTMEIVVNEAVKQKRKGRKRISSLLARLSIMVATGALLFLLTYSLVRYWEAEPDRFLVENLSAIENHERFAVVENDLDFLEQLDQFGLFSDRSLLDDKGDIREDVVPELPADKIPDSPEARKSYIESLDVEKKTKLKRKLDEFIKLSPEERAPFIEFDSMIGLHPDGDQLTVVMRDYYNWLGSLDEGERSRLLDLEKGKRIQMIAGLREKQAREAFGRMGATQLPSTMDAEVVFYWFIELIKANESRIRRHFPRAIMKFAQDNNFQAISTRRLQQMANSFPLNQLVNHLVRVDRRFIEDLVFKDIETLSLLLTSEAKNILLEQSLDEQRELVLQWVVSASQSRSGVSEEMLRRFAKTLSIDEQDQLDKLSTENYFKELKSKYQDRLMRSSEKNEVESRVWQSFFDF